MTAHALQVEHDIRGFQGQLAAVGHRIAGVHGQVHDHLLHLPGVHLDHRQSGGGNQLHRHLAAHEVVQHPFHVGNHPVDIQDFRLEKLLAAIRQQLPGQRGGAQRGRADFGGAFGQRTADGQFAQQQFTLPDDPRQEAVELVRNAARQFADRLQFLRLK